MSNPAVLSASGSLYVDLQDGGSTRAQVADNDPLRAAYATFISGFVPAANPTDILEIAGSATRIVRIRSILITGTATAASNIIINTVRRSTNATGGTPSTLTQVKRDNNDDAATSVIRTFAANPTVGTLIGTADGGRLNIAPAANGSIDRLPFQYSWMNDKAPILRGANDCLCLNLAGAAWPPGGALDINIVLTEDSFIRI